MSERAKGNFRNGPDIDLTLVGDFLFCGVKTHILIATSVVFYGSYYGLLYSRRKP